MDDGPRMCPSGWASDGRWARDGSRMGVGPGSTPLIQAWIGPGSTPDGPGARDTSPRWVSDGPCMFHPTPPLDLTPPPRCVVGWVRDVCGWARGGARPAKALGTIIVIDWDDTLLPSTWLLQQGLRIDGHAPSEARGAAAAARGRRREAPEHFPRGGAPRSSRPAPRTPAIPRSTSWGRPTRGPPDRSASAVLPQHADSSAREARPRHCVGNRSPRTFALAPV